MPWIESSMHQDKVNETNLKVKSLNIAVYRHRDYPGAWFLNCRPMIMRKRLKATDLPGAQKEALAFLRSHLRMLTQQIEDTLKEIEDVLKEKEDE